MNLALGQSGQESTSTVESLFMKPANFVFLLALIFIFPTGNAHSSACMTDDKNLQELLECMTVGSVRAHQAAFQSIADANGGTRATNTPGYDASVSYVAGQLIAAGYEVELSPFDYVFIPPVVLQQLTPVSADYESNVFTGSATGTVSGPVIPVDLALGSGSWPADPSTSTSGCEAADFSGLDFSGSNDIALIQRGACFFSVKAVNAQAAGAEAVVFLNQGNTPSRMGLVTGTVESLPDGSPSNLTIPVVGATFPDGVSLSQAASTAHIEVRPNEDRTAHNIIAELPGYWDDKVIMAGAHLDSVAAGPGSGKTGKTGRLWPR